MQHIDPISNIKMALTRAKHLLEYAPSAIEVDILLIFVIDGHPNFNKNKFSVNVS